MQACFCVRPAARDANNRSATIGEYFEGRPALPVSTISEFVIILALLLTRGSRLRRSLERNARPSRPQRLRARVRGKVHAGRRPYLVAIAKKCLASLTFTLCKTTVIPGVFIPAAHMIYASEWSAAMTVELSIGKVKAFDHQDLTAFSDSPTLPPNSIVTSSPLLDAPS